MAGYYDKNKDYSEEIAKTTDPQKRDRLLKERQNKMDDLGLNDKVASNDVVETWTPDYQPGGWNGYLNDGKGGFNPVNTTPQVRNKEIERYFEDIEREQRNYYNAAKRQNERALQNRLSTIDYEYDSLNRDTQNKGIQNTLINAEQLAALGLSRGAYDKPASGYAESSKVAQDNTLTSQIAQNNRTRLNAKDSIMDAIAKNNSQIDLASANALASLSLKEIDALLSRRKQDSDYILSMAALTGLLNGEPTLAGREAERERKIYEDELRQRQIENAFERWKIMGVLSNADAEILGIPAGTLTSDYYFSQLQSAINRLKASK